MFTNLIVGYNLVMVNMVYFLIVVKLVSIQELIAHHIMNFQFNQTSNNKMVGFSSQDQIMSNLQLSK
jgi:hypothetical protein